MTRDQLPLKNFKQMNKESVSKGACTSKTQKSFREHNQKFLKVVKGKCYIDYRLPDEEFVYGKPNNYDHSMNCLLGTFNLEFNHL